MYVVIREMRPYLTGRDIPDEKVQEFTKNFKDFISPVEIMIYKDGKLVKVVKKSPKKSHR